MTTQAPAILFRSDVLDTLAESVPFLVADLDNGEILWASPPLESLFGYSMRGELKGHHVEDLVPHHHRAVHAQHLKDYASGIKTRQIGVGVCVEGLHQNGTTFPIAVSLSRSVISSRRCVVAVVTQIRQSP